MPDQNRHRECVEELKVKLGQVILGKAEVIENVLVALLSGSHVLMEDVPGVGKTTLAKALAKSISGEFKRIQFTPDLLPTDILGSSIYNPRDGSFTFKQGPVFANILLADEINRASPRTQSSLLEAMSERQASIEGKTHSLPSPFLVIATQNPIEFHGTYPLPEVSCSSTWWTYLRPAPTFTKSAPGGASLIWRTSWMFSPVSSLAMSRLSRWWGRRSSKNSPESPAWWPSFRTGTRAGKTSCGKCGLPGWRLKSSW